VCIQNYLTKVILIKDVMRDSADNYREIIPIECCARCGYCECTSSLHVHHIDRNHDNNSPDNLIVLCANCHFGLHHSRWKLSDIGIFGFDTKMYRSSFKEAKYLKDQNTILSNENKALKKELKSASIGELHIVNHLIAKKKVALYNLSSKFGYAIRDEIAFFLNNVSDSFFEHIDAEDGIYTRDLIDNIHELYIVGKQYSNEIDVKEFNRLLKIRMDNGEANRKKIKESKIEGLTLTELTRKLPL
jgi:hypothetical protein